MSLGLAGVSRSSRGIGGPPTVATGSAAQRTGARAMATARTINRVMWHLLFGFARRRQQPPKAPEPLQFNRSRGSRPSRYAAAAAVFLARSPPVRRGARGLLEPDHP